MRKVLPQNKDVKVFMGSQQFSGDLAEEWQWKTRLTVENGGGGGGVEAPVERMRIERTVRENEKKERKWVKWMSRPREKMVSVKMSGGEWWVVELGGGTHGPQKCWLFFF